MMEKNRMVENKMELFPLQWWFGKVVEQFPVVCPHAQLQSYTHAHKGSTPTMVCDVVFLLQQRLTACSLFFGRVWALSKEECGVEERGRVG